MTRRRTAAAADQTGNGPAGREKGRRRRRPKSAPSRSTRSRSARPIAAASPTRTPGRRTATTSTVASRTSSTRTRPTSKQVCKRAPGAKRHDPSRRRRGHRQRLRQGDPAAPRAVHADALEDDQRLDRRPAASRSCSRSTGLTDDPAQTNTGLSGTLLVGGTFSKDPTVRPTFRPDRRLARTSPDPRRPDRGRVHQQGRLRERQGRRDGEAEPRRSAASRWPSRSTRRSSRSSTTRRPNRSRKARSPASSTPRSSSPAISSVAGRFSKDLCKGPTIEGIKTVDPAGERHALRRHAGSRTGRATESRSASASPPSRSRSRRRRRRRAVAPPDPCDPNAVQDAGVDSGGGGTRRGRRRHLTSPRVDAVMKPMTVIRGRDLRGEIALDVDAVVVGTGAGGSIALRELARAGMRAIALEEGGFHRAPTSTSARSTCSRCSSRKAAAARRSDLAIRVLGGRGVGGSTIHNTNLCKRTPDPILELVGAPLRRRRRGPARDGAALRGRSRTISSCRTIPEGASTATTTCSAAAAKRSAGAAASCAQPRRLHEERLLRAGLRVRRQAERAQGRCLPQAMAAGRDDLRRRRGARASSSSDGAAIGVEASRATSGRGRSRASRPREGRGPRGQRGRLRRARAPERHLPDPYSQLGRGLRMHPGRGRRPASSTSAIDAMARASRSRTSAPSTSRSRKAATGASGSSRRSRTRSAPRRRCPASAPRTCARCGTTGTCVLTAMVHDETVGEVGVDEDGDPVIRYAMIAADRAQLATRARAVRADPLRGRGARGDHPGGSAGSAHAQRRARRARPRLRPSARDPALRGASDGHDAHGRRSARERRVFDRRAPPRARASSSPTARSSRRASGSRRRSASTPSPSISPPTFCAISPPAHDEQNSVPRRARHIRTGRDEDPPRHLAARSGFGLAITGACVLACSKTPEPTPTTTGTPASVAASVSLPKPSAASAPPRPPPVPGPAADPEVLKTCTQLSKLRCMKLMCSTTAFALHEGPYPACLERTKNRCIYEQAPKESGITTDAIRACAKGQEAASCDEAVIGHVPACKHEPGKLADAETCVFDAQCKSQLCSGSLARSLTRLATGPGKCLPTIKEGAECKRIVVPLACAASTRSAASPKVEARTAARPRRAASTASSASEGKCAPPGKTGDSATPDGGTGNVRQPHGTLLRQDLEEMRSHSRYSKRATQMRR